MYSCYWNALYTDFGNSVHIGKQTVIQHIKVQCMILSIKTALQFSLHDSKESQLQLRFHATHAK